MIVDNKNKLKQVIQMYNDLQEEIMPTLADTCSNPHLIRSAAKSNIGTTAKKNGFNIDFDFIPLENTSFAQDPTSGVNLLDQVNAEISKTNNSVTLKSVINKVMLIVTPYRKRKTIVVLNEYERNILNIIAPMLFKILFLKDGPLDRFIEISKHKSPKKSSIIEYLVNFRHDIDLVTLWTHLLNIESSTNSTSTLSAELSLQKIVSTESNNIMSDFKDTVKYRKLSESRQMMSKTSARISIDATKKKVWANTVIKLMKDKFNVRRAVTDLFESMLWTVSHTHLWNLRKEWKNNMVIQELDRGFEDNMTTIAIGMGMFNNNIDIEEGIKHLGDVHDVLIRILNSSVNSNPPVLIDYTLHMNELMDHIGIFLNAVLGSFQPDIYKAWQLLMLCVLNYQSLHHTDKNVTYNNVKTLIKKYTKALETQLESFYRRYETNIEENLRLGYDIMEDIMTNSGDPSKSIDDLIYNAVLAKTEYDKDKSFVKMSKVTKRKFPTQMIHPLMSFIIFSMYMYQLHSQTNIKTTQKIKPVHLHDFNSIVPIPDTLDAGVWEDSVDVITYLCTGNRNGFREVPDKLNRFDPKSLFALCIILNNMIAYSNGVESPFSPSNIYKSIYFSAIGIHNDMTTIKN